MSDAKTSKKVEPVPKKVETAPKTTETAVSETTKTDKKSVDTPAPKSASQSSISHFSSVSTPEYRSGWDNIFGGKSETRKSKPDKVEENNFPQKLNLPDYDIDLKLRNALDVTFSDLAKKRGIDPETFKQSLKISYNINCEIKEK